MKRRATLIPDPGVDYDPSEVKVEEHHLSLTGLKGLREEKLTFSLRELPAVIVDAINNVHDLHIRWVSEKSYSRRDPYQSSLNSGLHINYTPSANLTDLCPSLKQIFSPTLRCDGSDASFTSPDVSLENPSSASSLQYYSLLPSLGHFVEWIQQEVCSSTNHLCNNEARLIKYVSYLDIDYDGISQALTVTALWSKAVDTLPVEILETTSDESWSLEMKTSRNDRNELGILRSSAGSEPAQLHMEGFLTVVGEDSTPKPTMFYIPSRHHGTGDGQKYNVSFDDPTGLHPTLRTSFTSAATLTAPSGAADDSTCALHAYFTFPSVLFADGYAFPTTADLDPLFTEAHNIVALKSLSGERDLEAPDYVIKKWGSAMLLELATPGTQVQSQKAASSSVSSSSSWDITIPLHLRYLRPAPGGIQVVEIPWPVVFWACTSKEDIAFVGNPFDRTGLGYDSLFDRRTVFYHLDPQTTGEQQRLVESIEVPVLDSDVMSFSTAELLTMLLVIGGFLWVAWKVVRQVKWDDELLVEEESEEQSQKKKVL